jgi:error-prone DNA polymerase
MQQKMLRNGFCMGFMADTALPAYAELHALSHFSFQRGASSPAELVNRAHALGYQALAITDACSMAGVVRAHQAAQAHGMHLLLGTEVRVATPDLGGGFTLVLLARNRKAYGHLCERISTWRNSQAPVLPARNTLDELPCHTAWNHAPHWPTTPHAWNDTLALLAPWRQLNSAHHPLGTPPEQTAAHLRWLQGLFPERCWLAVELTGHWSDAAWLRQMQQLGTAQHAPLVAAGNVHMHVRSRKPLQDVMTAIRLGRPVSDCGFALQPNAETHLRTRSRLAQIYPPHLLAETVRVAQLCSFSLSELRYEYPQEVVPAQHTPTSYLAEITWAGAQNRYPAGIPEGVTQQLKKELELIEELGYEKYFLTVYDIVRHARSQNILCQGRGSAANSAVCYCLGITEVDPKRGVNLFERFISRERHEPPDIDVDFEHQRREEVIQYLYRKFGRHRAALTAAVNTYHPRSAIRDVGKALGLPAQVVDTLAKNHQWWDGKELQTASLQTMGLDPSSRTIRLLQELTQQLIGFPRHLSQHSGGFVLTGDALTSTVPVIPAAMPGRTTIEWDKDDIDALGLLKVDVLALGMLTALRKTLALVGQRRGQRWELAHIPAEDPAVYDMISRADTVGVFQIESRAQMSMLPRLRPCCFYDLVVEVALVRPGPIQGGMVHPYLQARERQRQGLPLQLANEALRPALERTLGIPIFQEQVMQIAIIAAGFTPGEADGLRRSMAAWRRKGGVEQYKDRLVQGMLERGYSLDFAQAIFRQIEGFGEYGFPESHAASFALLVYASAWLKCHEPACFLVGMLNSLPMGFYGPSQLVQDARRHGVHVLPPDVLHSDWETTLTSDGSVRLGLKTVASLSETGAAQLLAARQQHVAWADTADLAHQARLSSADLQALARADALVGLSGPRRKQLWDATGCESMGTQAPPPLLLHWPSPSSPVELPPTTLGEDVLLDYQSIGLSLRSHPVGLLRTELNTHGLLSAAVLQTRPHHRWVRACGLVIARQRPGSAQGVVFVTLEDETGTVQVIVPPDQVEKHRRELLESRLLAVYGRWQKQGSGEHTVCHLLAHQLMNLTHRLQAVALQDLPVNSHDFH